jgi:hypothetical protein
VSRHHTSSFSGHFHNSIANPAHKQENFAGFLCALFASFARQSVAEVSATPRVWKSGS